MRYALAAAALVASAIAVPYNKRDVVTDIDIVYETTYVTVTAGAEPAETSTTAAATTSAAPQYYRSHSHHPWHSVWASSSSSSSAYVAPISEATSEAPAPTTYAPAPTSEAPSSTYVAPPPPTTTSVYIAPTSEAPVYSSPAASSAAPAPSGYGSVDGPNDYAKKTVFSHNLHRDNHSAPALEWDSGLAATAAVIASSCVYAHDVTTNGGGYGQNIAAGVEGDNITAIITDLFYNGEVNYFDGLYGEAQPDMTNFEKWGHFSQIVWADTTHVGCATQDCTAGGLANVGANVAKFFTVCNYKNPGNYANEYAKNVGASKKLATANWNTGL